MTTLYPITGGNIRVTHHIDAGERDAMGYYDYYYAYHIYEIEGQLHDQRVHVRARSYDDEPNQVLWLNKRNTLSPEQIELLSIGN